MKKLKTLLLAGAMAVTIVSAAFAKSLTTISDVNLEEIEYSKLFGSFADKCSTDYGYQDLKNNTSYDLATLYERIDEAVKAFDENGSFKSGNIYAYVDINDLKLGSGSAFNNNIQKVYAVYRLDHPLYFWMDSMISWTMEELSLRCASDYAQASARQAAYEKIKAEIEVYFDYIKDCTTNYSKVTALVYLMAQRNDYAYDADYVPSDLFGDHNIIGILADDHTAVCEGYAKSLQLMLNYLEIPNVIVYGESKADGSTIWQRHAWNMVKMDDGNYYYFDPTWSDVDLREHFDTDLEDFPYRMTYRFHAKGTSFTASHKAFTPSSEGNDYLYVLPSVPSTDYVPTVSGILPRESFNTQASYYEDDYLSNGDYTFVVMQNDGVHRQVEIVGISETLAKKENITIPATITYQGVTYNVCGDDVGIASKIKNGYEISAIKKLTLSEGINYISGNINNIQAPLTTLSLPASLGYVMTNSFGTMNLETISVASGNTHYVSKDGVLYTKDMKKLITYPAAKTATSYTVPDTVEYVDPMAFLWNISLADITLPADSNLYFENGALYEKESDVLYKYLAGGTEKTAVISAKCTDVNYYAFFGTDFDEIVIYNKDIEFFYGSSPLFNKLDSLIYTDEVTIYAYPDSSAQKLADYDTEDRYIFADINLLAGYKLTLNANTIALLENEKAGVVVSGLENGESYSGTVKFTVTSKDTCWVYIMKDGAKSYTRLKASETATANCYSFSFDADKDFEIAIVKAGDFTLDGAVDSADALQMLRYDVGKLTDVTALQLLAGNVGGDDSVINSADALQVLRYDVGKTGFKW